MHDFYTVLLGIYTRANTDKDLGVINRGVQEGQYFTVLAGPIF